MDPEIHDIKDMYKRKPQNHQGNTPQGASSLHKAIAIVTTLLAVAYGVSPIDLSPDAIPVLGWLDDFGILSVALLNLAQQFTADQNSSMAKVLRYAKWIMVILCAIAILFLFGLVAAIVALITRL
ncbi:MAG: DUF1232 domain-containing protein [Fibrobacteraceae bacterium]|nr:DUF1232 domain-containing protein [Fibrobacteraceae bacterium]